MSLEVLGAALTVAATMKIGTAATYAVSPVPGALAFVDLTACVPS